MSFNFATFPSRFSSVRVEVNAYPAMDVNDPGCRKKFNGGGIDELKTCFTKLFEEIDQNIVVEINSTLVCHNDDFELEKFILEADGVELVNWSTQSFTIIVHGEFVATIDLVVGSSAGGFNFNEKFGGEVPDEMWELQKQHQERAAASAQKCAAGSAVSKKLPAGKVPAKKPSSKTHPKNPKNIKPTPVTSKFVLDKDEMNGIQDNGNVSFNSGGSPKFKYPFSQNEMAGLEDLDHKCLFRGA